MESKTDCHLVPGDDQHILTISYECEMGYEGEDHDALNPLARAVRSLLIDGLPMKQFSLCFVDPTPEFSHEHEMRWLGAFVHTSADRILFFPGYSNLECGLTYVRANDRPEQHSLTVDHLTLEKNLREFHVTSAGSGNHLRCGRTRDLGEDRFLWFGMTVKDTSALRPLKRKVSAQATVAASDSGRRSDELGRAFGGIDYTCLGKV